MDIQQLQEQIAAETRSGKSILGKDGLLTPLLKGALGGENVLASIIGVIAMAVLAIWV